MAANSPAAGGWDDGYWTNNGTPYSGYGNNAGQAVHNGQTNDNFVFCDGHVKALRDNQTHGANCGVKTNPSSWDGTYGDGMWDLRQL